MKDVKINKEYPEPGTSKWWDDFVQGFVDAVDAQHLKNIESGFYDEEDDNHDEQPKDKC